MRNWAELRVIVRNCEELCGIARSCEEIKGLQARPILKPTCVENPNFNFNFIRRSLGEIYIEIFSC